MQGGGVCIFNDDCRGAAGRPVRGVVGPADDRRSDVQRSRRSARSPTWTKVYLPYCNQDVFIGGGSISNFEDITVHRFGAVNVRAALRYVRDVIWRELDRDDRGRLPAGPHARALRRFLRRRLRHDLQLPLRARRPAVGSHRRHTPTPAWRSTTASCSASASLGALLIADAPPLGWGSRNYLPPYCFAPNCGVGPVLLERDRAAPQGRPGAAVADPVEPGRRRPGRHDVLRLAPRLWINEMRASYCETRDLNGVQYFLPAITESVHVISPREELYTSRAVDGDHHARLARRRIQRARHRDRPRRGRHAGRRLSGVLPFPCAID